MDSKTKKWYAVYTKYKAEKLVAETLNLKDIEAYTPLLQRVKKYQRKIKTYHYPLINNYTFVKIDASEKKTVLETNHVVGFLKIGKEYDPIPEQEIQTLKRVVGENIELELQALNKNHIGEEVEIIHGSLTGLKGHLISVLNKTEFVIQLKQIGMQLQLGIHPRFLKKLSPIVD